MARLLLGANERGAGKVAGFLRINGAGESGLKPFVVSFKLVN